MTDLEKAKALLCDSDYTCVLVLDENIYTSMQKGISPMLDIIAEKKDVAGYSVADKIVGKAAAMLFAYAGVKAVYAEVISKTAVEILKKYNIPFAYGTLTDFIINRKGDGICPMEQTVSDIYELEKAYIALKNKRDELRKENVR